MICPKCGADIDEGSAFCQNCGGKIANDSKKIGNVETAPKTSNASDFNKKRNTGLIVLGYLTLIIELIAISGAWHSVKVINADRILLYPLLSVILSFYVSVKLLDNEKTFIHGIIIAVIAFLLFFIGTLM